MLTTASLREYLAKIYKGSATATWANLTQIQRDWITNNNQAVFNDLLDGRDDGAANICMIKPDYNQVAFKRVALPLSDALYVACFNLWNTYHIQTDFHMPSGVKDGDFQLDGIPPWPHTEGPSNRANWKAQIGAFHANGTALISVREDQLPPIPPMP